VTPRIRPLQASELERALDMWEALMANGAAVEPRWRMAPDARELMRQWAEVAWLRAVPFPHAWVAEAGELVGLVTAFPSADLPMMSAPPSARIGNLWVEPAWRGRGVGRRLVQACTEAAREAGYPDVAVATLTADGRAVSFWRALGFRDWQLTLVRGGGGQG